MRTVAMIPTYNEADVVSQIIEHLSSQGINVVILDDGSTDGTYEACLSYLGKEALSVERQATEKLEWATILRKLYRMALRFSPDWVLLNAADEFLESPNRELSLSDAIEIEAEKGYNLIQFNNFEFWPTERDHDNLEETDVRKRLKYYTWNDDVQYRCWKAYPDMKVDQGGSHFPSFPAGISANISPNKFVLRHYKIRSYEHGLRKVFAERLSRYTSEERNLGWHVHYDNFEKDRRYFVIDSTKLTKYNDDGNWKLIKTFDGTFGACPPVDGATILLREENRRLLADLTREQLVDRISILTEQLRELERQNADLKGSVALRITKKLPFDKHARKLFPKQRGPLARNETSCKNPRE